jgi:hypothetical protein
MTSTENLTALAFANAYAAPRGSDVAGYTVKADATADDFQVGQVVSIFSRGNNRLAVIEKIGRKNVTVIYVTEGGIKEAEKFRFNAINANAKSIAKAEQTSALRNWDYYAAPFQGYDWASAEEQAKYLAEHTARATEFLAEHPDREAYGQETYDKAIARVEARRESAKNSTPGSWANVTTKSVKFSEVGVK